MSVNNKNKLRLKRHKRNRKNIYGTSKVPRMYIFKSLKNFYVNIVDDETGKTLISESSLQLKDSNSKDNDLITKEIADNLASKASSLGIKEIVFDKSGYKYHGRIKKLADQLREKGLSF